MADLNLVLVRGIPGSGKSTIGQMLKVLAGFVHWEADMFFVNKDGEYCYDSSRIKEAHTWCLEQTAFSLAHENNTVVTNTFVQKWQMEPYRQLAKDTNARLHILVAQGDYGNIHNVPADSLIRMLRQWEN